MWKEGNPDEDPLLQVKQADLVIAAAVIPTSVQNYGSELINKLTVSQWATRTAM
jgi:hypothetical protein